MSDEQHQREDDERLANLVRRVRPRKRATQTADRRDRDLSRWRPLNERRARTVTITWDRDGAPRVTPR